MRILILIVCLLVVAVATSLTLNNSDAVAHTIRPGVIASGDGQSVFFMRPAGGINAVNITDGEILWHTDSADRPIQAAGGKLLAQVDSSKAGLLSMAIISTSDGEVLETPATALPEDVQARVANGMGSRFELTALNRGDDIELLWRFEKKTRQGAQLEAGQSPVPAKQFGEVSVNMASGEMIVMPQRNQPPKLAPADIEHAALDGIQGRQFVSADGEYVLASEQDNSDRWLRYVWRIYDLNGQLLGTTRSFVSYAPFMVRNSVLMFVLPASQKAAAGGQIIEQPLSLAAVDLADGQQIWRHEIRDTSYRGPIPP